MRSRRGSTRPGPPSRRQGRSDPGPRGIQQVHESLPARRVDPAAGPGGDAIPPTPPWAQGDLAEARLAKALAERTQIEVAGATLEVARTWTEQRSAPRTSPCPRPAMMISGCPELMAEVKRRAVDEARRGAGDRRERLRVRGGSEPRFPAWWSSATATSATSSRPASRS